MIHIDLPTLINTLNDQTKVVLEQAGALCMSRQNPEVTISHFLIALMENPFSDLKVMIKQLNISTASVRDELQKSLSRENHHLTVPAFSPLLVELLKDAFLLSSTSLGAESTRSGAIFIAMLMRPDRYLPMNLMPIFQAINKEALVTNFDQYTQGSSESPCYDTPQEEARAAKSALPAQDSYVARYCVDLTEMARRGELDPVLCRDDEMDLMIDILSRRRKNNPILVGDAGVGKSAVLEGLALRIVSSNVPEPLQSISLVSLDLGLLQAGASIKGEFEKRLKHLIAEIKHAPTPIILFIDEAHTLIGAGNQEGSTDAANLLKPALARGELRTIAATTWKEYKKYIEKDPALTRRFQLIKIKAPSQEQALEILRGLHEVYEQTHQVMITDDALKSAVALSARFISGRQLPDKAIDVLDTACARMAINQSCLPKSLQDIEIRQIARLRQIDLIKRDSVLGQGDHDDQLTTLYERESDDQQMKKLLTARWEYQKKLVQTILDLRQLLIEEKTNNDTIPNETNDQIVTQSEHSKISREALVAKLQAAKGEFDSIPAGDKLIFPHVDSEQVAHVIADWSGIPVNQITGDELMRLTQLPKILGEKIKGQEFALKKIHRHLLTAKADLRREGRPKGAFLLVGPSGVGKTETVTQLAHLVYGAKQFLITVNMTEYQEKHTVSRLIGSPAGYIGYGEGGVLTEAIRKQPYSVVLLDEVEKAHPDVLNLFYQAFDKGEIADGEGRVIDCQNVVFCLTTNLGYQTIVNHAGDLAQLDQVLYPQLVEFFKPALLARMEIVPFLPLSSDTMIRIIHHKLASLRDLLVERYKADVVVDDAVLPEILARVTCSENGARMVESIIDGQMLPNIAQCLLEKMARNESVNFIRIGVEGQQFKGVVI